MQALRNVVLFGIGLYLVSTSGAQAWEPFVGLGNVVKKEQKNATHGAPCNLFLCFEREQNIDTHQVGHVKVTIDKDGNGSIEDFWSNGQQLSGNDFYAVVVLVDKHKRKIFEDTEFKGLNASFGGHATEGTVVKKFFLTKDEMASFDHVEFRLGTENCGLTIVPSFKEGIGFDASPHKCSGAPTPGHTSRSGAHQVK